MSDQSTAFLDRLEVTFELNGEERTHAVRPSWTLVDFLRRELGLTGTTEGCGVGVCGCCTVLVDGRPINSCQELAVNVDGTTVTTIEGLSDGDELAPVQEAYRQEEGFQCGYCTPGMIMMTQALFDDLEDPSGEEVREYMAENLCRCTGYDSIIAAIDYAQELMRPPSASD